MELEFDSEVVEEYAYDDDMFMGIDETEANYKNSAPMDVHLWSDDKEVASAVEAICHELEYATSKARKHMKVVLLNLYSNWLVDRTRWTGYSRNSSAYQIPRRYNPQQIKYDVLTNVVDKLLEHEYIEHKKGFNDRASGIGYQSRMRASEKMIELIKSYGLKPYMICRHDLEELIIFKDEEKNIIQYRDSRRIDKMRRILRKYNVLLAGTYIDVNDEAETIEKEYDIDLSRKLVKRVFNNRDWKQGGRFYNAWWMGCPKKLRRHIVIDRYPAVEYDYSGLHIHLLYAMEGINYAAKGEDAYTIPGFPNRTLNKLLLLIAINAKNLTKCKGALRDKIRNDPDTFKEAQVDIDMLVEAFRAKHEPIAQYFFSGKGLMLQNIDAQIAEYVVNYFTSKNKPVLTVHDSFICRNIDADILKIQMLEAYNKHVQLPHEIEPEELDSLYLHDEQDSTNIKIQDEALTSSHGEHTNIEELEPNNQAIRQLHWLETGNVTLYCRLSNSNISNLRDTGRHEVDEDELQMLRELLK